MNMPRLSSLGIKSSHTDFVLSDLKWLLEGIISVSSDEILEQKLGVGEVTGIIFPWLSVASDKSFFKIGSVPNPSLHIFTLEKMLSLGNKFISSHLDVLIEEVASKNLLSVLSVEHLWVQESISKNSLSDELEILVMEEHVVVIQEQEWHEGKVHHVLFE